MSASVETENVGVWTHPIDVPRDHSALADAVLGFYAECAAAPDTMTVNGRRLSDRAFRAAAFRDVVRDPSVLAVSLWSKRRQDVPDVRCDLRWNNPDNREFARLSVTLLSPLSPLTTTPTLHGFIAAVARLYPLAQGFVAGFRSPAYAALECIVASYSPFDLDEATRERLGEDQMLRRRFPTRLRRLYPVTIIGPEIWSRLPPMPKVDSKPLVEDLGGCKMLTVWPDLVEPHDPAFLARTVALRRWLWPFTIQNPADAVEPLPAM